MALNPPLGNTSPEVLLDNAKRLDELVNGPAATVPDRADVPLDSWRQIMAMVAAAIIEAQNSITAIGLPFSTLDDAQAAVSDGKIPEGAVTWVRDIDDTELADEYKNISGTLTATGRKMPSQQSIDKYFQVLPDGTFALMADNGVVFAIDKNAVIRAVSLAVQDVIGIGDASIRLYPQASGFYILGENGMPLALGPDSVLRLVAANISGVGFEPDLIGVPLLIRGDNGIALALDNGGNLRTLGIVTDKLIVGGKDIAGGGDSVFSAGDRYVNSDGDLVPLLPDTKKMSAWGSSSLVVSGGSANFAAMASELGVEDWNNQGQPGESSFQSAARFGGVPFTLNFPGNIIPASGSVAVTCTQTPSNFRNSSLKSFTGTVAGVPGTLSWSSSSLRFTRTGTGDSVSLSGGADFVPTIPASYRDGVVLLWMYKNDIKWDAVANPEVNEDAIFNNVLKTVTHLTTLGKRALVIGIFNDSSYSNSIFKTRLESLNNRMRDYFGDLYCDTQDYICSSQIWTDTGITPTTSDLEMQTQGYKATSLSADNGHLSSIANKAVVQNVIKPKLVNLGWYK
ncbi:TPA: hypothetical protein L7578_003385 [Klebsiella pneumoniae subsp. pneumoniae]|uniref:hypothetical protein n=1 Tax=Klebsiella pneumoniae TaxID=573 RepID=UPI00103459BF|nr:hypothetical protein [Klebsiella pneumoniae]HBQ5690663.1 hypothetical protein [Klebsiella pneumoniae subsp. pneumoniae]MDM7131927.1 hypothetical protein [Klebsiella pneumoniae]HBQ5706410.1 hypothetical protein [Klebsiella pneumoniae subsp. pneumoniae]HBW7981085.1 hypothetical protein [Klebsiella pneumoniae]HBW8118654.1 hypothetical protein [Klebsiella pneumoniae]